MDMDKGEYMKIYEFNKKDNGEYNLSNQFFSASTGEPVKIGPFCKKFLKAVSQTSPKFAKKIAEKMDIDSNKLTEFWHENLKKSGVDAETAKKSYDALREIGAISSDIPKSKITESVRNAGKVLDSNGG
jgi:hypothetical protein